MQPGNKNMVTQQALSMLTQHLWGMLFSAHLQRVPVFIPLGDAYEAAIFCDGPHQEIISLIQIIFAQTQRNIGTALT